MLDAYSTPLHSHPDPFPFAPPGCRLANTLAPPPNLVRLDFSASFGALRQPLPKILVEAEGLEELYINSKIDFSSWLTVGVADSFKTEITVCICDLYFQKGFLHVFLLDCKKPNSKKI